MLHVWSLCTLCCLASFVCDKSMIAVVTWACSGVDNQIIQFCSGTNEDSGGLGNRGTSLTVFLWQLLCNVMQVHMTNKKLSALDWWHTAQCCKGLITIGLASSLFLVVRRLLFVGSKVLDSNLKLCLVCCFATLVLQCGALCHTATSALLNVKHDETIKSTARFLYLNAAMVILGPFFSFVAFFDYVQQSHSTRLQRFEHFHPFLKNLPTASLDVLIQVCNALLLSGLVGPRQWDQPIEAFRKLVDMSGFDGLACKRIAFNGHINDAAQDCVVSFPGHYSDLWDHAVQAAKVQDRFSLACVFLTDKDSGLGKHSRNPATGRCWCHDIYGPMEASSYLSVIDLNPESGQPISKETLAFEKADARAMNKVVIIKREKITGCSWSPGSFNSKLEEALVQAESRCVANQRRPPWGCRWFEEWKNNVDKAIAKGQTLHVFYFEGKKGEGKMAWEKLSDSEAMSEARAHTGLGRSQTAEVAYLDRQKAKYEEHDINDFESFMASRNPVAAKNRSSGMDKSGNR
ncbi:unnamed protein product, partial [Symbiodinium sp. CCMP2456]